MDTIIFGDSLAGNYGLTKGKTWPELLKESPELTISRIIFMNGYTSTDLLECLEREVLTHDPEQVIFICGTNDAAALRSAESIFRTVKVIAGSIREKGGEPLWLIPPQIDPDQAVRTWRDPLSVYHRTNEILAELRRIGKDQTAVAAIDGEEFRKNFTTTGRDPYTDGVHFTAGFHGYLAGELLELFKH